MSNLLLPVRAPDVPTFALAPTDSRLSVTDRLALRLGLWLLTRSAVRVQRVGDRTQRANLRRNAAARETRELAAQRRHLLSLKV